MQKIEGQVQLGEFPEALRRARIGTKIEERLKYVEGDGSHDDQGKKPCILVEYRADRGVDSRFIGDALLPASRSVQPNA